jgi:HD-like signal output (HDOD) protein
MKMSSADFLDRLHEIPSVPKVVEELLATFDRDDATLDVVARLIGSDPGISAKVLRLANSPLYRRSRGFTSIYDAVMFIGLHAARTVVLGAGLAGAIHCPPGFQREAFWRYCLHTAVAARYFARAARADGDTAFTVGLIHAIGEPMMYASLPEAMHALDDRVPFADEERADAESSTFGFSFSDVSADLAERWNFPDTMTCAIRHACRPQAVNVFCPMAGFVWLGSRHAAAVELPVEPVAQRQDLVPLLDRLRVPVNTLQSLPPVTELAEGLEDLVA